MSENQRIQSFKEFWPYYLNEHSKPKTKLIHFVGTSFVFLIFIGALITTNYLLLLILPVVGYGPAWYAHFFVEKNKPVTFQYPVYSLMGDFKLWFYFLIGKI